MTKSPDYGVVPQEVLLSYDGLTFLQALIAGSFPAPPIAKTLGFVLIVVEPGRAVFEGEPKFDYYNPLGVVHGGYAATLLDSALGCSVHTTMAKGEAYTTLELKLNMVRPITSTVGVLSAEGRVIHRGRSVATAEGQLKDRTGKLYAHATTTCMIFPARS